MPGRALNGHSKSPYNREAGDLPRGGKRDAATRRGTPAAAQTRKGEMWVLLGASGRNQPSVTLILALVRLTSDFSPLERPESTLSLFKPLGLW